MSQTASGGFVFRVQGHCPLCEQDTEFVAKRDTPLTEKWFPHWFRDSLKCTNCASLPRERALFAVVQQLYPHWRELRIHESSPSPRGASHRFRAECSDYIATQYAPSLGFGKQHPSGSYRSENLESQTFGDESFDLVITQDVFEHLLSPDQAIAEIARTLRPGGAHILTVPIVNGVQPSVRRARRGTDGAAEMLAPEKYHGNPMTPKGSLVTIDWGYDIIDYLAAHSGLSILMFYIDDLSRGLRASYNEVLVCRKATRPLAI